MVKTSLQKISIQKLEATKSSFPFIFHQRIFITEFNKTKIVCKISLISKLHIDYNKDFPVITAGFSMPINSMMVGAKSPNTPL